MITVVASELVSGPLARCLAPAVAWLRSHPGAGCGTVLVGPPDPAAWAAAREGDGPLVLVGALGPIAPAPLHAVAASRAAAVVALSDDEAARLAVAAGRDRRVVLSPLDAPDSEGTVTGVAAAAGCEGLPAIRMVELARLSRAEPTAGAAGPGVRWVGGVGSHPLAAALCAAADGAVPVAVPGTACAREIRAAGGLVARTPLEAVEAAALVRGAPALHDALVARVRRTVTRAVPVVAEAAIEALSAVAHTAAARGG